MKIAGIQGGKQKGVAKQLSAEDKAKETLKEAAAKYGEEVGALCFVTDVKVDPSLAVSPSGKLLRGKYDNNAYRASGTCTINFRSLTKNVALKPKSASFKLSFKDSLDAIGLPDTEMVSYNFKVV